MGHGADDVRMDRRRETDPRIEQRRQGSLAVEPEWLEIDLDEVRLHALEVDREACLHERFCEPARAGVVVREPLDVVVERIDAGRCDDPGLPHRASEEVLLPPRALDRDSREPASSAPSGQPRPFERQSVTVSKREAIVDGSTPSAVDAFSSRAPSR